MAILRELHPLTGEGRYVFPGLRTGSRPMSENTVNAALRRLGYSGEEMTGHGFRSMAATQLNEMGWSPDAIERQLAHAETNKVREAYTHAAQYLDERVRMMEAWADTWMHCARHVTLCQWLERLRKSQGQQLTSCRHQLAGPSIGFANRFWPNAIKLWLEGGRLALRAVVRADDRQSACV